MRLLIVGGSDAGISAALRARELDETVDIDLVLADAYPNYSICGLPFFLSGETPDWKSLAHRTNFDGIAIHPGHRAERIDVARRSVEVRNSASTRDFPYDRLLIATGASPRLMRIPGADLANVFHLHSMADSFRLKNYLETSKPARVLIIGAGYIGLEMADALRHRDLEVTVISRPATVLPTVDPSFGKLLAEELKQHDVQLFTGIEVERIDQHDGCLRVSTSAGAFDCDVVLAAVGVRPNTELGEAIGIPLGRGESLRIDQQMRSVVPNVFVAGDCGETWHRLLQRNAYLPLGTTAHKQGRVAGENMLGAQRKFEGSLGTQVVKIFDLVVARTGLREDEAVAEGHTALTATVTVNDHKAYYPGATPMRISITADGNTGQLLGAQILGRFGAEVSKRIDILASALFHNMTVDQISDLDLSYTPPLSSPWDPVQLACQRWTAAHHHAVERSHV